MGWVLKVPSRPLFPQERDSAGIEQEAGWAPEPVWTGANYLGPPGFDPRIIQTLAIPYTD